MNISIKDHTFFYLQLQNLKSGMDEDDDDEDDDDDVWQSRSIVVRMLSRSSHFDRCVLPLLWPILSAVPLMLLHSVHIHRGLDATAGALDWEDSSIGV